ncbi:MAG TPA: HEAT repeat domain-containing protein [Pirellulales bacterium]|nr:HEAT repeat domain-containing protein [Pirellulales bacterium]
MPRLFWRARSCLAVLACLLAGCQRGPHTISPAERAGKAVERRAKVASSRREPLIRLTTIPAFRQWGVRETAADALARIGDAAVPALIDTLHDPDQEVRAQAAQALARMGGKAAPAVDALIQALDDPNEEVRRGAARALGQIGPEAGEAVPALIKAIKDPRNKKRTEEAEVEVKVEEKLPAESTEKTPG